jgi:hypothetical protein
MTGKIQEVFNNKFKNTYNVNDNKDIINTILNIEENLLSNANITEKTAQYKLKDQITSGFFKFFQNGNVKSESTKTKQSLVTTRFILKISGIWTTDVNYGVTYKFIKVE